MKIKEATDFEHDSFSLMDSEDFCDSFEVGEAWVAFCATGTDYGDHIEYVYALVDVHSGYWFSYQARLTGGRDEDKDEVEIEKMLKAAYPMKGAYPKYLYLESDDIHSPAFTSFLSSQGVEFRKESPEKFESRTKEIRDALRNA